MSRTRGDKAEATRDKVGSGGDRARHASADDDPVRDNVGACGDKDGTDPQHAGTAGDKDGAAATDDGGRSARRGMPWGGVGMERDMSRVAPSHVGTRPTRHTPPASPRALIIATWNNAQWNSGALWSVATPPAPANTQPKHRKHTMKRQRYFPCLVAERPEWFNNLATQLTPANVTLELDAAHGMTQARDAAPHRSHAIIGVRPEVG